MVCNAVLSDGSATEIVITDSATASVSTVFVVLATDPVDYTGLQPVPQRWQQTGEHGVCA